MRVIEWWRQGLRDWWRERPRAADAVTLLAACALALAVVRWIAPPFWGHDTHAHLRWQFEFGRQLLQGEWYPRWFADLNEGFGSPAFFVYPPLAHYAAALFLLVPGADAFVRVQASMLLAIFASAFAMHAWLRMFTGRSAALAGALLYAIAPYHLYIDWYRRAALSELWAFVWLPLALLALRRAGDSALRAFLFASAAIAGLLLTHPPSTLFLAPAIVVLSAFDTRGRRAAAVAVAIAFAASVFAGALAAVYLLPALTHEPFTNMRAMFIEHMTWHRWLLLRRPTYIGCGEGFYVHACQLAAVAWGQFAAAGVLALAAVLTLQRRMPGNALLGACLVGNALVLFMMSSWSAPVWAALPLLEKMQFPWRMVALQCFLLAVPCAILIDRGSHVSRVARVARVARVVAAVGCLSLVALAAGDRYAGHFGDKHETKPPLAMTEVDEYAIGDLREMKAIFRGGSRWALLGGDAEVNVTQWQARDIRLHVKAAQPSRIALHQLNDRGWQWRSADGALNTSQPLSLAAPVAVLDLPAGEYDVEARLEPAAPERIGRWVSASALLAWLALAAVAIRRARRTRGQSRHVS